MRTRVATGSTIEAPATLREAAPAKLNLALHVVGRRADGYHLIDSLVAFAAPDDGDVLAVTFGAGDAPRLSVKGPFAADVPAGEDNIVVRAARAAGGIAAIGLWKGLPVASGIGGGSADAAAVLRLAARARKLPLETCADAALALGADVPVCLASTPARMQGIGERLTPAALPSAHVVLVNPGVPVSTAAVFAALARRDNPPLPPLPACRDAVELAGWLATTRNDLEPPALALAPSVATALAAMRAQDCLLARMSGSGGTVFGIFPDAAAQEAAARALARPAWWVRTATV